MKVIITPVAQRDLDAIGAYISKDDPRAAVRFLTTLRVRLRRIGNFPKAGRGVELPGYQALRRVIWRQYLIFYLVQDNVVLVTRILHGARDFENTLTRRSSDPGEEA